MVRAPYIDKKGLKRGAWSEEEDNKLRAYILRYKAWNWNHLPRFAGLARCGKSCRMRWENYLKPGVRRGGFSKEEEELILKMQKKHGNKWSLTAKMIGRTDNEIKNYWHTILSKRIKQQQDQNSNEFMGNSHKKSEEMHGVEQTENVSDEPEPTQKRKHSSVDCLSETLFSTCNSTQSKLDAIAVPNPRFGSEPFAINGPLVTTTETYMSLEDPMPMTSTTWIGASDNDNVFPNINVHSTDSYGDGVLSGDTFSSIDTIASYGDTFWSLMYEPLLVNSSNTEEAPTTYTSFSTLEEEDLIMNSEECFSVTPDSFNTVPFLVDNSILSSTGFDFCPTWINFPTGNYISGFETHDSMCMLTNPSLHPDDGLNRPILQGTMLETSTLLNCLDSMESFEFWKALWNFVK